MKAIKKPFIVWSWKTLWIILLPVQWLLFSVINSYPHFVEVWYSEGLYGFLSFLLRAVTKWLPFSFGEIAVYFLILFIPYYLFGGIYRISKKKQTAFSFITGSLTTLIATGSIIYFLFMVLWGFNYHREPLVNVAGKKFSTEQLKSLCEILITETNENRKAIGDSGELQKIKKSDIISDAYNSYIDLKIGNRNLYYALPSVKSILFTGLFSYLGVTGIYNPFTGEANVNSDPPLFLLPATVCHEMAHQAGIAPEDEANYVSFTACRRSNNPVFRYSGYLMAMRYSLNALRKSDPVSFDELRKKISAGVKSDLDENRKYWLKFKNPFEKYSDKVYDKYLKANNQKAGIKSYGLMVTLLLNDYSKKGVLQF